MTATALVEPRARSGRSAATERRRRRRRTLNQSSETLIKRQPHTHRGERFQEARASQSCDFFLFSFPRIGEKQIANR